MVLAGSRSLAHGSACNAATLLPAPARNRQQALRNDRGVE